MTTSITRGVHHIGLTVSKLEESAEFFKTVLGWKEVRRKEEYPAIFVSDGSIMLTLWAVKSEEPIQFDRKKNIGLHHLALAIEDENKLNNLHAKLVNHGLVIEFAPELVGQGPAKHLMCYDPSGIRIEFIWPGN